MDQTTIDEGGTPTFALNRASYEIDLSNANQEKLREALAPYVEAGRWVRPAPSHNTSSAASAEERDAIRIWARENG